MSITNQVCEEPIVDALAAFRSDAFYRDPQPILTWLRENDPVHRTSTGAYLLSRYADAKFMLRNSGTVFRAPDRDNLHLELPIGAGRRSLRMILTTIGGSNPPDHTRLRGLITRTFSARAILGLTGRVNEVCRGLLDAVEEPLRDGEVIDLRSRIAKPLMITIFSELFGVPVADGELLSKGVSDVMAAMAGMLDELWAVADDRTAWIEQYFTELVRTRRENPGDDLLSRLIVATDDESGKLTDEELLATVWGMWVAGYESTAGGIDFSTMYMLAHPDKRHYLETESGTMSFVDEVLRCEAFVILSPLPRVAMEDVELSGVVVPKGAQVQAILAAANRDPREFADPERFDPSRDASGHLTFGQGIHHCIGAGLARMEAGVVLRQLRERFPNLVAADTPTRSKLFIQRTLTYHPVALER